jgi:hypothetical protein
MPIRILALWAFDFKGRTFAYGLSYGIDAMQDGSRVPLGAASGVMFYDVDGTGRFTIIRAARFPFVPELIPNWVEKLDTVSH